ncbi:UDP-N-acetylglucosamine--N-acetylmuramyl-(pentapeptide) pyrophosphoryl-undecaprenol N-acetylglucosamine transferase [Candidatus Roizmanbacteria bacterium]|nr:UDP-N-acetylglucosamine--N-acetylmuramyl-(pentapeptide) pyrophosphoryl-undecaprenol N-acetylglucosamine transferase [Candidatus Roizmanbacteria bacterium]
MKILVTGGHVTPALALLERLKDHEIVFVGRKYALESEQTLSLEYKEITRRNIRFIHLQTGRLNRLVSTATIASVLRIPFGFFQGFRIIKEERPQIILTFGSYLAVPIAFWAYLSEIPVYLHEQTSIPGKANRFIGLFAKKIFVSFPETERFFPKHKVFLTGNPIRTSVFKSKKKPTTFYKDRPVIYVTGGSLGSHGINLHLKNILPALLKKYIVIHQVGDTAKYNDYEMLLNFKEQLPERLKSFYFPKKHFLEEEIGYVYAQADVVVGRAGANTFFELISLEKPAIFIPLPWSAGKEQQKQAEIFQKEGVGEIFPQSEPSERLAVLIDTVVKNLFQYRKNFKNLRRLYKKDAADIILKEIFKE